MAAHTAAVKQYAATTECMSDRARLAVDGDAVPPPEAPAVPPPEAPALEPLSHLPSLINPLMYVWPLKLTALEVP